MNWRKRNEVLRLTYALVRYGTISHPVKRQIRDMVVPALASTAVIQRRAARRITHVGVVYGPGPLARPDPWRSTPRPGQRMPHIQVHLADGQASTLHNVLRHGRHVLVVPPADLASVRHEAALQPYRNDIDIVAGAPRIAHNGPPVVPRIARNGTAPAALVRPDGHAAVRAKPATLDPVISYLRDLLGEPAGNRVPRERAIQRS